MAANPNFHNIFVPLAALRAPETPESIAALGRVAQMYAGGRQCGDVGNCGYGITITEDHEAADPGYRIVGECPVDRASCAKVIEALRAFWLIQLTQPASIDDYDAYR